MMKNYFLSGMLLLGATALMGTQVAEAEGAWRNVNAQYVKNPSNVEGWNGMATGGWSNVAEFFQSGGYLYTVVADAPAGEYTFTAHGFYRASDPDRAYAWYRQDKENALRSLYAFIDDEEAQMKNLFDEYSFDELGGNGNYTWIAPNGCDTSEAAFKAGKYETVVKCNHPGGDLYVGVKCYGNPDYAGDEWTCFGVFKLVGPNGEVTLPALNVKGANTDWNITGVGGDKGRGIHGGAVWSKTNASPYNFSQTVELPAGKYRFAAQGFNCHFLGTRSGYFVPMKGDHKETTGKSAYDLYKENTSTYYGKEYNSNDAEWAWGQGQAYNVEAIEAYVFIYVGDKRIGTAKANNNFLNPWYNDEITDFDPVEEEEVVIAGPLKDGEWAQTPIKNLFSVELDNYPDCCNYKLENGTWKYLNDNNTPMWFESGHERESAAFFAKNPSLYQNYAELTITEPTKVTFGLRKDVGQKNYWQPNTDMRLEKWDENYAGYIPASMKEAAGVDNVFVDEDAAAPVVYYNLQGVRVENPANGLYIKVQGKKATKVLMR